MFVSFNDKDVDEFIEFEENANTEKRNCFRTCKVIHRDGE